MKKTNFSIDLIATLQQMIRFTPIGEPDKDAMCKFKVLIPDGTTVKDIIDFALTQDEWGTIEVRHGDITIISQRAHRFSCGMNGIGSQARKRCQNLCFS